MRIEGIDHVQVAAPAGGEDDARRFYGAILGMAEIAKPHEMAVRGGVWFQCGPQQLHVGIETDFRPAKKAHPGFIVAGLDDLVDALELAGYPVRRTEALPGRRRLFVDDPFGNRLELIELDDR